MESTPDLSPEALMEDAREAAGGLDAPGVGLDVLEGTVVIGAVWLVV